MCITGAICNCVILSALITYLTFSLNWLKSSESNEVCNYYTFSSVSSSNRMNWTSSVRYVAISGMKKNDFLRWSTSNWKNSSHFLTRYCTRYCNDVCTSFYACTYLKSHMRFKWIPSMSLAAATRYYAYYRCMYGSTYILTYGCAQIFRCNNPNRKKNAINVSLLNPNRKLYIYK